MNNFWALIPNMMHNRSDLELYGASLVGFGKIKFKKRIKYSRTPYSI